MKVLLVEDEPIAQQRIERIIKKRIDHVEVIAKAQSITEFVEVLDSDLTIDLILCDIHLADGLSFKALELREISIPIIFITAYDQYALNAFDHYCLDYILKPIEGERLVKAFQKFFSLGKSSNSSPISPKIVEQLLSQYAPKTYKKRFLTKIGNKFKFVPVEEISCFFVKDAITYLIESRSSQKYIVDQTLNELQRSLLDPNKFYRINRSVIIHLESMVEMRPYQNGRLSLSLNGYRNKNELVVSRERVSDFKNWINQ